jgi:hypothetical protein
MVFKICCEGNANAPFNQLCRNNSAYFLFIDYSIYLYNYKSYWI